MGKIDEMNVNSKQLQHSNNETEMQKFRPVITYKVTLRECTQYTFPTFYECKIDENYLQTFFGYIEKMQEKIYIYLLKRNSYPTLIWEEKY